ncbi:hypothetical protein GCM10010082_15930 [Kushneria pakistanensis]|uniref:Uncharacterized protein n=1 Tax=Kushneria pakistanensis TaxID=1508770 RepID=A0ABQ3FHJ9_9GAMM|nr:hypothetical protein GCM10010082_15930 [Kushneria pakistanensis]
MQRFFFARGAADNEILTHQGDFGGLTRTLRHDITSDMGQPLAVTLRWWAAMHGVLPDSAAGRRAVSLRLQHHYRETAGGGQRAAPGREFMIPATGTISQGMQYAVR